MKLTPNQEEILSMISLQHNLASDCHEEASVPIVHDMIFQHNAYRMMRSEYKSIESIKHLKNHDLDKCECNRKVRFMLDINSQ